MAPVGCQWVSGVCIAGKTCSYNFGLPTKGWICVQFLGGSPPVGAGLPAMGAVVYQQVRGARIAGKTCSYNLDCPPRVGFVSNFSGAVHLWERACPRWGPWCISRCAAPASQARPAPTTWTAHQGLDLCPTSWGQFTCGSGLARDGDRVASAGARRLHRRQARDGQLTNFRSEGASWASFCTVLPSRPVCRSRWMTTIWLLFWLATST